MNTSSWSTQSPRPALVERDAIEEGLDFLRRQRETGKAIPFLALVDALAGPELLHLGLRHQTGVVVLVALEGQAEALDRVGDEADRLIRRCGGEGLEDGLEIVPAEIGHQAGKLRIRMVPDDFQRILTASKVGLELLPPGGSALEHECGIQLVGAVIDPSAQVLAARPREDLLEQLAVLQ